MRADDVARSQDNGQLIAAGNFTEQQESAQQRQPARAGHRQRHACAVARFLALLPVADQQKRRQAGQLPEDQQLDDILRQCNAQHRAHEQQHIAIEAPHAVAR